MLGHAIAEFSDAGEISGYVGTITDITERKRAEEDRMHLATAIEQTAEGLIVTNRDWVIRYVNPAVERMTGYSRSEIIGKHSRILKSDKHDRAFYKNIRDTLARGEVWAGHLVNRRKDGTFYETEVTSSPVLDSACNMLAKELMAIRPDIPIILCTGFSELINEKQAKEMGIQEFVMKPFVIGKHAKTIRKVLEQKS